MRSILPYIVEIYAIIATKLTKGEFMPKGVLVQTSVDEKSGRHFGVKLGESVFPVDDHDVDVRMLEGGAEVTFITDKDTGRAILAEPAPKIGCERAK